MTVPKITRRPLTSRNTNWAKATARWLARVGMRPNQISLWSLVFATLAGLTLVCAGVVEGGWLAAVLAVITAYVRALGTSAGASPYFLGPMAKPHRMAVMTAACLIMAALILCGRPVNLIHPAL